MQRAFVWRRCVTRTRGVDCDMTACCGAQLLRDNGTCVHSVYGARALRKQMQVCGARCA